MIDLDVPPEEPQTPAEEPLEDASAAERTSDASDHAGRKAREDEQRERQSGEPSGDET